MLLGGIALVAIACSARSNPGGVVLTDGGGEADARAPSVDAGPDGGDSEEDPPISAPQTHLRLAQLSPDLPPVDVCVAPHGTMSFQGPLLAQLAARIGEESGADAARPGLAYAQVSAYLPLDEGPYDVRLVMAGASSCSASLPFASAPDADSGDNDGASADSADGDGETEGGQDGAQATDAGADGSSGTPDWTNLPSLAFNTYTTLIVAGDWEPAGADPGLTVALLPDDAVLAGPAAVLRAVNAVPSWSGADFGLGSFATDWTPILVDVSFATASAHAGAGDGVVDVDGYLPIAPQQLAQAMGARPSSGDSGIAVAAASSVEIDLGSIATVIAIGGKTGDSAHPPALLLCTDNQPSGAFLSDCGVSQ